MTKIENWPPPIPETRRTDLYPPIEQPKNSMISTLLFIGLALVLIVTVIISASNNVSSEEKTFTEIWNNSSQEDQLDMCKIYDANASQLRTIIQDTLDVDTSGSWFDEFFDRNCTEDLV
jgi:hypothetical protein